MLRPVDKAYHRFESARPLVRPTYNQFEVTLLPPYGDPEVDIPSEIGTYAVLVLLANVVVEHLFDE
ncbi:MAG: hypothetical protein ACOCSF_04805 [Halanaeroarchaeum sp.]